MSDNSKRDCDPVAVGVLSALGGVVTLIVIFYYIINGHTGADRWQALGMVAVAVAIAFAVTAMLRFALAPLIGPQPAPADGDVMVRSRIAPLVLTIGSIAIVALATALIVSFAVLASMDGFENLRPKIDTLLTGVFSTVLPVVATWVGTVLAFYFGSENFRQAAQSTREAFVSQAATAKKITDVMIPYERIARLDANDEADADAKPFEDVINMMSEAAPRVIVFNKNTQTPIYVIRSSTPPMPEGWITPDYHAGREVTRPVDAAHPKKTIQIYLDQFGGKNKADATNFRFIDVNATPEAAIALMKREDVDDLFITKDGQPNSKVLGWAAMKDLLKK